MCHIVNYAALSSKKTKNIQLHLRKMGSTQKYSLKWNDFTVNVASTFRDLHSRHDFVDVTLACSDGSTLEAHKVILSSVSSYFRDILKVTMIYLVCKFHVIIYPATLGILVCTFSFSHRQIHANIQ